MPKSKRMKPVKAWAVICPAGGHLWAFEHKDAASEARVLHDNQCHGKHQIVRVLISPIPKGRKKGK